MSKIAEARELAKTLLREASAIQVEFLTLKELDTIDRLGGPDWITYQANADADVCLPAKIVERLLAEARRGALGRAAVKAISDSTYDLQAAELDSFGLPADEWDEI